MARKGGKRPGAGRPKGSANKVTRELREMISGALIAVGGQAYLEKQATEQPTAFLNLIGKTLPKDVNLNATGKLVLTMELSSASRSG